MFTSRLQGFKPLRIIWKIVKLTNRRLKYETSPAGLKKMKIRLFHNSVSWIDSYNKTIDVLSQENL